MRKNRGFTLVELIIVMACLSMVTLFFWTILSSSSEDTYTINEKIEVQTSVTSLMNRIQKDIQEAELITVNSDIETGIIIKIEANRYIFNTNYASGGISYETDTIEYLFDEENRTVTRNEGKSSSSVGSVYYNIVSFEMTPVKKDKYGAKVEIVGGRKPIDPEETDRSRYELSSTYYTRNTRR